MEKVLIYSSIDANCCLSVICVSSCGEDVYLRRWIACQGAPNTYKQNQWLFSPGNFTQYSCFIWVPNYPKDLPLAHMVMDKNLSLYISQVWGMSNHLFLGYTARE
jgi:hypothetical protein